MFYLVDIKIKKEQKELELSMEIAYLIRINIKVSVLAFMLLLSQNVSAGEDDIAVISFNKNFATLSVGKVKMLYRGKLKRLNGQKYALIDWPAGSAMKIDFYKSLLGQSESKINAARAKLVFSGKGYPPKVLSKDYYPTLEAYLKLHPNSIGYALLSDVSDELHILYTIKGEE
jgi:hypothetical protein